MANPLDALIQAFKRLPGVGEKTALRYALHVLNAPGPEVSDLVAAIRRVREELKLCSICYNLTDVDPCHICSDPKRDASKLCVLETPVDLIAVEKSGRFRGVYHVIHGLLSPLDGVGPDDIKVRELVQRVESGELKEVILALNPTVEGEATASYLADRLKRKGVTVSRIAYGIPMGGSLEYTDPLTLTRAFENRRQI